MRRSGLVLIIPAALLAAAAQAQPAPEAPPSSEPAASAPAPAEPAPAAPASAAPATQAARPVAAPAPAARPEATPPKPPKEEEPYRPRLLAPTFPEDRYPGDPIGGATDVELARPGKAPPLRFALHGYFRAPMRFSRVHRGEGTTKEGEGNYNYRTPFLIDDHYYQSGFLYLPINERPWSETYLSVGNDKLTATVGIMSSQFTNHEAYDVEKQFGVTQGWLTYRFNPMDGLNIKVKGGAFWDRFGYLPKYDTYLFGRTHQVGGQVRADYQMGDFTFWGLGGVGTYNEQINAKMGLTMLTYGSVGASWNRTVEVAGYYVKSATKDKRAMQELTDADMSVIGADARVSTMFGRGYVGYSSISADQVLFLAPALEVMHSYGRFIMDNYLGQNSNNGVGGLKNVAFQYDLSVRDLVQGLTKSKSGPLPWGGDITASVFGVYTKVASDQRVDPSVTDPNEIRKQHKDGISKWKWGSELGWRATDWAGIYLRYDHVVADLDDSATSFRVLSPRVALFTHFLTNEMIFVQFSRYWYKDAVFLREGQEAMEKYPDEKVFKLQAQITY